MAMTVQEYINENGDLPLWLKDIILKEILKFKREGKFGLIN
jgi:hypothetical protein